MSYDPNPKTETGGKKHVDVSDDLNLRLLGDILLQLRIMNLHLSSMTDESFDERDLD